MFPLPDFGAYNTPTRAPTPRPARNHPKLLLLSLSDIALSSSSLLRRAIRHARNAYGAVDYSVSTLWMPSPPPVGLRGPPQHLSLFGLHSCFRSHRLRPARIVTRSAGITSGRWSSTLFRRTSYDEPANPNLSSDRPLRCCHGGPVDRCDPLARLQERHPKVPSTMHDTCQQCAHRAHQ